MHELYEVSEKPIEIIITGKEMKSILDGLGEVELVEFMGGDLAVVNSARVSYNRKKAKLDNKDRKLINYLWKNKHTSPFRHSTLQFRIKAPLFVIRQWQKHTIGCAWNERSGRYVEFEQEFYNPSFLFESDPKIKQGSAKEKITGHCLTVFKESVRESFESYHALLAIGVSKEHARTVLPLASITECYWTCSLQALLHFLDLRLDSHSQYEIRLFAIEIYKLVKGLKSFETSLEVWKKDFIKKTENDEIIQEFLNA